MRPLTFSSWEGVYFSLRRNHSTKIQLQISYPREVNMGIVNKYPNIYRKHVQNILIFQLVLLKKKKKRLTDGKKDMFTSVYENTNSQFALKHCREEKMKHPTCQNNVYIQQFCCRIQWLGLICQTNLVSETQLLNIILLLFSI